MIRLHVKVATVGMARDFVSSHADKHQPNQGSIFMRYQSSVFGSLLALSVACGAAQAAPIQFTYTATVTGTNYELSGVQVGSPAHSAMTQPHRPVPTPYHRTSTFTAFLPPIK